MKRKVCLYDTLLLKNLYKINPITNKNDDAKVPCHFEKSEKPESKKTIHENIYWPTSKPIESEAVIGIWPPERKRVSWKPKKTEAPISKDQSI